MTNTIVTTGIGPETLTLETLRSHNLAVTHTHQLSAFHNL
jgi:hypothetical protein